MKILITTDTYFPMTNGVVISMDNLYKQLKLLGHDVKILTLSSDGNEHISGDIYYFSSYNSNIYPNTRVIKLGQNKIIKELIKWNPDIIHSQSEFSTMIVAKYLKRKLNIPQVHTYHTMYEDYLHYFLGGKVLRKTVVSKLTGILLNTFETVIAPTEKIKEKLESCNVSTNIEVAPTGINIEKFQKGLSQVEKEKLLSRYGLSSKDTILLYVGRIAEEKNIEEVLSLYNNALRYVKNTKLLIVGGGPDLPKLKDIVKKYGIEEYVKFTDMINTDEIYKYYNLGDIFITASISETQGITYIEALASGLPVICRWDMCIKDLIIDRQTGFTYKNEEEFKNALINIVLNEELKRHMGTNIQSKVRSYSVERFGERILEVYNTVLDQKDIHYLMKKI
ncbi:glycosyl transferase [Clostridium sp. DMHC 10]|uniref:glycosyltransferase family 4 protein n=1 Tax=Clostridium sp. DMHC 10 TaxID=747377 RepID=UPI00069E2912|nr:glycosyltransferase family 4 protein [Clostridium sp. DMHC 10]KOF57194.1 glycosyl transferase [Clostridium sp. DMHC 10]